MNFGQRLKKLREENNLTQDQFAKIINKSRSSIAGYEIGDREPDFNTAQLIAQFFNVSLDYLLSFSNIRNPYNDESQFPIEFSSADEARAYINKHQIFGSNGFDADKLNDVEILEFANTLLEQMKMVSYKYKKQE